MGSYLHEKDKCIKTMRQNTLRLLLWYSERLENEVFLMHVGLAILVGYTLYFLYPLEFPWSWMVPITIAIFLYYYAKGLVRKKLSQMVRTAAKDFSEKPSFKSKTTEELIEAIDIEILSAIRDNGGDYIKFMPDLALTFDTDEVVAGLGKLTSLEKVKAYTDKIVLTAEGMEILSTPPVSLSYTIPPDLAERIVKVKLLMKSQDFGSAIDEVNKLFEYLLRNEFKKKYQDDYETEWNTLRKNQSVKRDFSKASLGELLSACRQVRILKRGDFFENLILAFLKIRVPGKHETEEVVVAEENAQTALDLAQSFLRHWYR